MRQPSKKRFQRSPSVGQVKKVMGTDVKISELDVLGESLGRDNCFAGIKGRIAPGDMTFARISTDDGLGMIKAYVGEGRFTDDPLECDGGVGKVGGLCFRDQRFCRRRGAII